MRIAVASLGDPRAVQTWSGIPSNIISALMKQGHEIHSITLTRPPEPWHFRWLRRFYCRTQNKWFMASVEQQLLKRISAQLDREVNCNQPDVVLVIHGDWLAYATFQYPACIIHDTTFASIVDYYPTFTNLTARSVRNGNRMYQKALDRSDAAIFSANWASQSAIKHYGYPATKVFTIPFGANLEVIPRAEDVAQWMDSRTESEICNFLFIGVDWHRKGGPDTLRIVAALNRIGVKTALTIVGCSPEIPPEMKRYVSVAGFLRKDKSSDAATLAMILTQSHALILPSKAECYGCVYCEANAFGLPALGRDTGGVAEIIKEGINGLLLKSEESIESFAARWASIWMNQAAYRELSHTSYLEFRQRLNYDVFANELAKVLVTIVQEKPPSVLTR